MALKPRYPVYVPSKGRAETCLTARMLMRDEVPFRLVIEEQEREAYGSRYGYENLLILPFRDRGSVVPARNWIKEHATAEGAERHWQLDDNIKGMRRWWDHRRPPCRAGIAMQVTEEFTDRYENIAISGIEYSMWGLNNNGGPPFRLNTRVYSCSLVNNAIPYEWRGRYNEDTDICLQALAGGWCTVLITAFLVDKNVTMKMKGGNTDALYQGDGRLKMARSLERVWPHVVSTRRRFQRPQHVVRDSWQRFDNELRLKPGVDLEELARRPNPYDELIRAVKQH
jgi:hypothetical protein